MNETDDLDRSSRRETNLVVVHVQPTLAFVGEPLSVEIRGSLSDGMKPVAVLDVRSNTGEKIAEYVFTLKEEGLAGCVYVGSIEPIQVPGRYIIRATIGTSGIFSIETVDVEPEESKTATEMFERALEWRIAASDCLRENRIEECVALLIQAGETYSLVGEASCAATTWRDLAFLELSLQDELSGCDFAVKALHQGLFDHDPSAASRLLRVVLSHRPENVSTQADYEDVLLHVFSTHPGYAYTEASLIMDEMSVSDQQRYALAIQKLFPSRVLRGTITVSNHRHQGRWSTPRYADAYVEIENNERNSIVLNYLLQDENRLKELVGV